MPRARKPGTSMPSMPTSTKAVSQAQQYLVLSNLTSDYELDELTAEEHADTAQVDWVRVFDASSRQASRVTVGRKAS